MNSTEDYVAVVSMLAFVILFGIIGFILLRKSEKKKKARLEELRLNYHRALSSKNKPAALNAGRQYYSSLRKNGRLTTYDEQAISNDLAAMV